MSDKPWTTPADIVAALRRRWDRGELLKQVAGGMPWEPIRVPVRGPTARQLSEDLGAVQTWVASLDQPGWRLETRRVGGRLIGANELPAAVWFDTPEQAFVRLRVGADVAAYRRLLDAARAADPGLAEWATQHPLRALRHTDDWELVVRTVLWLRDRVGTGVYLRQIDVPGVDTKFIEAREGVLGELLEAVGCQRSPGSGRRLERGFGFADKPDRIRLRSLDGAGLLPGTPLSDVSVRMDELVDLAPRWASVLVVENEITFLALPSLPGVLAVFGAGFDVLRLARLRWLDEARIVYWGDIDTHGFVILDRLRAVFPQVESVLMDADTLAAHRGQWVSEPRPSREHVGRLTEGEGGVYADLVGDVHGPAVRLEQERINYARVLGALQVL
ncbi:MAG: Wadjet anti-phage system protein JetD domain-containing protein [Ornithinimicrobium sp.]